MKNSDALLIALALGAGAWLLSRRSTAAAALPRPAPGFAAGDYGTQLGTQPGTFAEAQNIFGQFNNIMGSPFAGVGSVLGGAAPYGRMTPAPAAPAYWWDGQ